MGSEQGEPVTPDAVCACADSAAKNAQHAITVRPARMDGSITLDSIWLVSLAE